MNSPNSCYPKDLPKAQPTEKHLTAVKRIFRYLKDTIYMGLWYPKDTGFELSTFSDSDHAGCLDSRKSTSGGIQFLDGDKLVSWSKEKVEKGIVELFFVGTEYQLADLFTKALSVERFQYLVRRLAEAIHIILSGTRDDIYSIVDACTTAKEMWIAIKRLKQGESLNKQDVMTNLFLEFDKLTTRDGVSIESYYLRFYKMMNEMIINKLEVATMHSAKECRKPKWVKEYVYHNEKMMLYKHEEKGVPLSAEQDLGPTYDAEPLEHVQSTDDYNMFATKREHSEHLESINDTYVVETVDSNVILNSSEKYQECENLKLELLRVKHKRFAILEHQCIKLELALQHQKEKNVYENSWVSQPLTSGQNNSLIVELNNKTLEINDLKAQLQDKTIAIAEMRKLLNQMKVKSMYTNFSKPSIMGKPPLQKIINQPVENDLLTGTRGYDLYTTALQESTSPTPLCFMTKASPTQAWLWHRRLYHLNFDTINLLSKNDITKIVQSSKGRLHLLHMDLCGPMHVERINGKKYILVIVDDYSRYTWTHFKRSKDITPEVHDRLSKDDSKRSSSSNTSDRSLQDLELLFTPMYKEYFNAGNKSVSKSFALFDNSLKQVTQPTLNVKPITRPILQPTKVNVEENNINQVENASFEAYEFINFFALPGPEAAKSSSRNEEVYVSQLDGFIDPDHPEKSTISGKNFMD
nr:hypothetical protein [Tanacetum cinerariifolium]